MLNSSESPGRLKLHSHLWCHLYSAIFGNASFLMQRSLRYFGVLRWRASRVGGGQQLGFVYRCLYIATPLSTRYALVAFSILYQGACLSLMQAEYRMATPKQQSIGEAGLNRFLKKLRCSAQGISIRAPKEGLSIVPMIDNGGSRCWWDYVCSTLIARVSLKFNSLFPAKGFQSWNLGVCLPLDLCLSPLEKNQGPRSSASKHDSVKTPHAACSLGRTA
jgi:hypothetical protein